MKQRAAGAAVLLGDLDAHEAHLEELLDQRRVDLAVALHLLHERPHFVVREAGDGVAEHHLVVGEDRQRRMGDAAESLDMVGSASVGDRRRCDDRSEVMS